MEKKNSISLVIFLVVLLALFIPSVLAFNASTSTYDISGSFHTGLAGGNGTAVTYNSRYTTTYQGGGNYLFKSESYSGNVGWLGGMIAPIIVINTPSDPYYCLGEDVPFDIDITVHADSVFVDIDGGGLQYIANSTNHVDGTLVLIDEGSYIITFYANDSLDDWAVSSVSLEYVSTGTECILRESGSGVGNFLAGVTNPLVDFIVLLGMIAGILVVVFSIAGAVKRSGRAFLNGVDK